ncbi:MAG TPA: VOC family protein [Candidatus Kapabacteria bacterium]|nr:VOC family protein [Candidatus Kapabacteria bacterium]
MCELMMGGSAAQAYDLTNYSLRLDHVTYLTRNLDSLTKAFQRRGFTVTPGDSKVLDMERHFVNLPDGTYIELQSTSSTDTNDWRIRSLVRYGDHIASVTFQTPDLPLLRSKLESDSMEIGEILDERYEGQLLWRAFGVKDCEPLDIVFVQREQDLVELPIQHSNGHRRIEWVIFSTVEESEPILRKLFDALDLTKRHEGWFDYWMMGSPEARLNVRIGPPYNPLFKRDGGIFIEENGLTFAY